MEAGARQPLLLPGPKSAQTNAVEETVSGCHRRHRPTNNNSEYAANLCTSIKSSAAQFPNSPVWVAGEFNLPDIDWTTDSIKSQQYLKSISSCFLDLASNFGITQSVSFPTRIDITLDVFLTNRPSLINRCELIPGVSDHGCAVIIDSNVKKAATCMKKSLQLFKPT